jgi:DNA-binding XRE family transcriptional regulator
MTRKFEDFKKKLLKDPEVLKAYEGSKREFEVAEALISARIKAKMTQVEVAKRMNTTQSAIARLESGNHLPSLHTLFKYAHAINRKIDLHIEP